MDEGTNPFAPNAGAPPPELVGRDPILDQARILLERVKNKRSAKSMLLTGLRGTGKTVLLVEIDLLAERSGYRTIFLEAKEGQSLGELLATPLRALLLSLDRLAGAGNKAKRGLAVLRGFMSALKISYGDYTIGLDAQSEQLTADSGDLETDLPNLFVAVGEAAEERKTAVAVLVDEIQYCSQKELGALIMAMHKIQQRQLPIVLVGAGLPTLPGLAGNSKSYAERLFSFPTIGALTELDTARALQEPARSEGANFDREALADIYAITEGYPYFVQEWGYHCWNASAERLITPEVVRTATARAMTQLDEGFFHVRFDRLTPSEKRFLRAMASLGPGPYRSGDVASRLGLSVNHAAPVRAKLIAKGMIYSPEYGELAYTVPMFDKFMMRAMPE